MKWLRSLDRKVGLPILRFLVERGVLAAMPNPLRIVPRLIGRRLAVLTPAIDGAFYCRQLPDPSAAQAAARDPAFHYLAVGRFHNYAPHPDFDPIRYREHNPHLSWLHDPLFDQLSGCGRQPARAPQQHMPAAGAVTVVTLHHGRGGGSAHHLALFEDEQRAAGSRVVALRRLSLGRPLFRATDTATDTHIGPVFDLVAEPEHLRDLLRSFALVRLVVSHIVDLPPEALATVTAACKQAEAPYEVHLHDYFALCPRVDLIDGTGRYCGCPFREACVGCRLVVKGRPPVSREDWRTLTHAFVSAADRVVAPSQDTAERHAVHWPDVRVTVRRPEDDSTILLPVPKAVRSSEPATVAILGRLNVPKGFDVVLGLARCVQRLKLPVRLVLIGYSIDDGALKRSGVAVQGRFRPGEAETLLQRTAPDLVFIPAIWPETWSFVLSSALRARVPVCAFDIGAVAERLRALQSGRLLSLNLTTHPEELAGQLMACLSREHVACEDDSMARQTT